ncbi:MAG TPA: LysR family transcriptional regulator [Candidatus Dormibacteraeota bacterium]
MELRQLRAFVEVADSGHFRVAAERLKLTQPALTQRIQALERELGLQLLERNARQVRLAPAGSVLLTHARLLVQTEDEALRGLKAYSSGNLGRISIAYQAAGDVATAGSIIAEYRRRFPAVEIETTSGSSGPNLRLLQNHAADVAFALMGNTRPDGIVARGVRREEVSVALRTDHHLAHMDPVPVTALRGEPITLPPAGANPDLIAALQHWLIRQTGEPLNIVAWEPSDLAIETMGRTGAAAVLVIRRYIPEPANGMVYRSLSPAPLIELVIAHRRDDSSPTVANLMRLVEELAPNPLGDVPDDGELI